MSFKKRQPPKLSEEATEKFRKRITNNMRKIKLNEYTVIEDLNNGIFKALRHGEEWRNLIGDNLVLSLVEELSIANDLLEKACDFINNSNGGETLFDEIADFLDSKNE